MKVDKKFFAKLVILLSLFLFDLNLVLRLDHQLNNDTNLQPKVSGLTPPIVIDNSTGSLINWTWAVGQPWCSGQGTENEPYIIEDLTINGNGIGSCIEIRNSNEYFIIENCTVYNSGNTYLYDAGIKLNNTNNGLITENNCSNNYHGILLIENCDNDKIFNNYIFDAIEGTALYYGCDYNKIDNNTYIDNIRSIWLSSYKESSFSTNLQSSNNNSICNNYIYNSIYSAIGMSEGCSNNSINNNIIDLTDHGIILITTKGANNFNNIIFNNVLSRGNDIAIEIYNNTYTEIIENKIINLKHGQSSIKLSFSQFNKILNNQIQNYSTFVGGIYLYKSKFNAIRGNIITNNTEGGIFNPKCEAGGIYISSSENNSISENKIHNDDIDGICLYHSNSNVVYNNKLYENINTGIKVDEAGDTGSDENFFYKNVFLNNGRNAVDYGINNNWNSTTIGNYWDNYTGTDANFDGIGDIPYDVPPSGGSKDYLPIWDDHAPIINIISPLNHSKVERTAPELKVEIIEPNLDSMWYTIDGGKNNITFISNGTIDQASWELLWDNLSHGDTIRIMFYANDTYSQFGFSFVDLIIEKKKPSKLIGLDFFITNIIILVNCGIAIIALIYKMHSKKQILNY